MLEKNAAKFRGFRSDFRHSISVFCRSTSEQCLTKPGADGAYLFIAFIVKPRSPCYFVKCRQRFNNTVEQISMTLKARTALLLTLANGSTVSIELAFCSFGKIQPGEAIMFHVLLQDSLCLHSSIHERSCFELRFLCVQPKIYLNTSHTITNQNIITRSQ